MAKHAVPKKKQSTTRSNRRYRTFENSARLKLRGMTNIVKCEKCGVAKVAHKVCADCGCYQGKDVMGKIKKQEAKITKIKAE
ncbi:MAG: 50S ribosomal protein L32 [Candidatus Gracilibacteria bacterium]